MKLIYFLIILSIFWLSTCSAPNALPAAVESVVPATEEPAPESTQTAAPVEAKLPAVPFESETYFNEEAGFALDYPAGWTVSETVIGPRGTQILFLSSPEIAELETVPEGGTRLSATIHQWDPKNDLAAFVESRKTAWEASGFTTVEEEQLVLELGLPAARFLIQTPDADVVFLIAALGDQYLVISGEGDLELVEEISLRLRPIEVK